MAEEPKPLWMERWFQLLLGSLVLITVASLLIPWVLGLLYALRSVLLPLVVALGLAYIFNPVVSFLHRRLKLPRWVGTGAVLVGAGWLILILSLLILPPLIQQAGDLINNAKTYPERISQAIQINNEKAEEAAETGDATPTETEAIEDASAVATTGGETAAGDLAKTVSADTATSQPDTAGAPGLKEQGQQTLDHLRAMIEDAIGKDRAAELLASAAAWLSELDWGQAAQFALRSLDVGVGAVGSAISLTSYLALSAVIVVFCFFFFSWKLDDLVAWFIPFIPASHRNEVLGVMVQMDKSVAAFIRGRLIQASVMAIILSIGWWLAGVPSWLLLGVLSGMLNLVPFAAVFGFIVALSLATVDAFAGGSFTIWVLIWPTFVYGLAQVLDGWVVEPIVQGKATDLDPVSVLVAVMIGGALAGLLGMLIAIPSAACIKILSREIVLPRLRALAANGKPTETG